MAIDINRLRQNALFSGYGMGLPDMYDPGQMTQTRPPDIPRQELDPITPDLSGFGVGRFNPSSIGGTEIQMGPPPSQMGVKPVDRYGEMFDTINKYYTPTSRDIDRLSGLLDEYPERNNPSFGRKLTASMVALGDPTKGGGIQGAENVMYAPYMRDLSAWKEKAGPFQAAATAENARNINERQLTGNIVTNMTAQDRADQQAEAARRREDTIRSRDQSNAQIQRQRDYLRYVASGDTVQDVIKDGPTVVVLFKNGRRMDTGIPSDSVSDLELEAYRQSGQRANIIEKGNQDRQTNAAPGGMSARDVDAFEQQRRRQVYDLNPDLQDQFSTDGGVIALKPMPEVQNGVFWSGWGRVTEADLDNWYRARQLIYPNAPPRPPKQAPVQTPNPAVGGTGGGLAPTPGFVPPPQQSFAPATPPSNFMPAPRGSAAPPTQQPTPVTGVTPPRGAVQQPTGPQLSPEQIQQARIQEQGIREGKLVRVQNAVSGEIIVIPNNYQSIQDGVTKGWYVVRNK